MQQYSPPSTYSIIGLDSRDLALLRAACLNQSSFLAHLAAGRYGEHVVNRAGYSQDQRSACHDAERLRQIAEAFS